MKIYDGGILYQLRSKGFWWCGGISLVKSVEVYNKTITQSISEMENISRCAE